WLVRGGRQRARRQPVTRLALVVAPRSHVVRPVGVEQRRQVLDLPAAGAELEHAASVERDPLGRAVVIEVEQLAEEAEARGLYVQGPGRECETLNGGDGGDGSVPGNAVPVRAQDRVRLFGQ